jgi:hypothetical protein
MYGSAESLSDNPAAGVTLDIKRVPSVNQHKPRSTANYAAYLSPASL